MSTASSTSRWTLGGTLRWSAISLLREPAASEALHGRVAAVLSKPLSIADVLREVRRLVGIAP
jgi:hypothetical protein